MRDTPPLEFSPEAEKPGQVKKLRKGTAPATGVDLKVILKAVAPEAGKNVASVCEHFFGIAHADMGADWVHQSGGILSISGKLRGYWPEQCDIKVGGQFCIPIDPSPGEQTVADKNFVVARHWDDTVTVKCRLGALPPGDHNTPVTITEPTATQDFI